MEVLFSKPQLIDTFSSLGTIRGDVYMIGDKALDILNEINCKLICEDKSLLTFRRSVGKNINSDLIPFLINVKEYRLIDKIIRILVNITIPIECLLTNNVLKTDLEQNKINDLNKLLASSKESFTDVRTTRAVVDYMKNIIEKDSRLTYEQCDSINNCLLLLRNILHIPENGNASTTMQNKILWNLFTLSIDKLLIYLLSCPQRSFWSGTLVQLIALMYKDQQASTLQKLLNNWLEDSLSDSSEDFESNTSPPTESHGDSSPTSDSSDNGSRSTNKQIDQNNDERRSTPFTSIAKDHEPRKCSEYSGTIRKMNNIKSNQMTTQRNQSFSKPTNIVKSNTAATNCKLNQKVYLSENTNNENSGRKCPSLSELSDCGYATQVENHESISTSSNEDNYPCQKVHQKPPCNQKQRYNATKGTRNATSNQDKKEWRRKKLVKRSKSSLINMKGLLHHTPTNEDISNILKEFTVDFLLKGYGCLVQDLYKKNLYENELQTNIDTSHFFWMVTYFLKFAAQLELDLDHIKCVLSFDIISYLTFEGVNIYEQINELTSHHQYIDLIPNLRRIHLVVTAIREFLMALDTYKQMTHLNPLDVDYIRLLQLQISGTDDLKQLFILLIRNFNPSIQSRQYLQDLIVTNHILLLIPDSIVQTMIDKKAQNIKMIEHIKQFGTVEIMQQYGLLLENFIENGEFVNDCIFTMMHHIGGDLGQVTTLFQPVILKTYTRLWETEYELCDDWCDLIEYVIHKFINTPQQKSFMMPIGLQDIDTVSLHNNTNGICDDIWNQDEIDILYWYYEQSKLETDIIGHIVELFNESEFKNKSRLSIIQRLLQQDIIALSEYNDFMKIVNNKIDHFKENQLMTSTTTPTATEKVIVDKTNAENKIIVNKANEKSTDEIQVLKNKLIKENKGKLILWLQKLLVECCFAKLCCINKRLILNSIENGLNGVTVIEPIPHHCILKKKSVPVVPWNDEQTNILLYHPFTLLLHKLGFHLPADAGKLFIRIPEFWSADILYDVAKKLGPIDKSIMKFDINELNGSSTIDEKSPESKSIAEHSFAIPRVRKTNLLLRRASCTTPSPIGFELMIHSKTLNFKVTNSTSTTFTSSPLIRSTEHFHPPNTIDPFTMMPMPSIQHQMNVDVLPNDNNDETIIDESDTESDTASVTSDLTRMYVSDDDFESKKPKST